MITELRIKNFRGLEDVSFSGLSRVNLISGRNGVGKTSVLEALYLFLAPNWPEPLNTIAGNRGLFPLSSDDLFEDLFTDFDSEQDFRIWVSQSDQSTHDHVRACVRKRLRVSLPSSGTGRDEGFAAPDGVTRVGSDHELVFDRSNQTTLVNRSTAWLTRYSYPGPQSTIVDDRIEGQSDKIFDQVPIHYLSHRVPAAQAWGGLFGQMQREGSDDEILDLLRSIEPRVRQVLPIPGSNGLDIYVKIDGMRPALPISLIGEGLNRVFQLAVLTRSVRNGILLIDEIENGLHFRSLPQMFSSLYELADMFDVQVFAVTHSDECVQAAREAIGNTDDRGLAYYRLGREKDGVKAHHFDIDKLDRAHEFHMEVR